MRRSINVLCLSATALVLVVLLPAGVIAQQKSLKEQIQGPWSFVSCNDTNAKGEKTFRCANNPRGILILAGNGNYANTVITSGRKDAEAPGVEANFGTWSVNEADKTLTRHRVGARDPAAEGIDFKANINLSLSGEEMRITGDAGGVHVDSTYRRFK
jgi:hypothetical protein